MKNMKKYAKQKLPKWAVNLLINTHSRYIGFQAFRYDKSRFKRHYLKSLKRANIVQIEGKLIFHAHSIEKGLSHDNLRLGFGKSALINLAEALKAYKKCGYDPSRRSYINALSTLKEYVRVHDGAKYNIDYLQPMFGAFLNEAVLCRSDIGGAMTIDAKSKSNNTLKNFKDLFSERYSVRTYSKNPVELKKIHDAIALSMKSPSVCNRQSARVHILTNRQIIQQILTVQGGITGYDIPPVLLTITTDSSSFLALTERNQVYIDGGLFAMSLLLSLEYEGLAACPLNAMLSAKQDKSIRRLLNIKPSENIIVFISVGNFKKINNVPKSFRLEPNEITTHIK